jgi:DNA topoisomerase VI subunit B
MPIADPRKRPAPTLERVTFKTSRLAEFCGEKELVAQTGHDVRDWPMVILKELADNALDAAEEAGIAPEISIEVSTERGEIIIADNGPGLPPETVEGVLDYTSRVSSREAYVSPTRGAQGNALKTIVAIPFALDGSRGITVIEAYGLAHRIIFEMDPVRREPKVLREISPSLVQNGTRVTVRWPDSASSVLEDAEDRFVQMAGNFTTFNPHLTLSFDWDGKLSVKLPATNPGFRKWRACDPTSAHWYDVDRFGRYMAAHIARDEDQGRAGRTVRDFISELRGLARSDKQKVVLAESSVSGTSLARFFEDGTGPIPRLLGSCKRHTKTVDPKDLGVIGADHLFRQCLGMGAAAESFKYRKRLGVTSDGLPCVIEAAFAYCPNAADYSTLATGINFSVGIRDPFQRIGYFESLSSLLEHRMAGADEPIVFLLHYTCPRVDYTDRGKSTLALPSECSAAIRDLVETVTKDWFTQRKREEKEASRKYERRDRLASVKKVSKKAAAWEIMEEAYLKASDGGKLPAKARQIMYAARPKILAMTGMDTLDDAYFTQNLLVDYINEHPDRCADWNVVWDARGTFNEPHTGMEIPLGTLEVLQYLGERPSFGTFTNVAFSDHFPTSGPKNRFDTVLYVEKEGFESLLKAAAIAERFDVAVMTTKGMSVTAARLLLDRLSRAGAVRRILALHDFDISGFSIFGTLGTSNRRYKFENVVPLVDLGLRLVNVQAMNLESEPVTVSGDWAKRSATLRRHGANEDEIIFLKNRRVELNAMTSREMIDFIEAKLAEHGVTKIIPDDATIEQHARRVLEHQLTEQAIAKVSKDVAEQAKEASLPVELRRLVQDKLKEWPQLSWDIALASIIRN